MKLTDAEEGEYIISNFLCGRRALDRCIIMGLKIGEPIEVRVNKKGMPVVIKAKSVYSIGRGLAEKILVKSK